MRRLIDRLRLWLPDREAMRATGLYRRFGAPLLAPPLWRLERRSVAGGVGVGLFVAATPTLGQMVIVAFLALRLRVNLPAALLACGITNPVTMPFIYYGEYLLGAAMAAWLGLETPDAASFGTVLERSGSVFGRVVAGSALAAPLAGMVGYGAAAALFPGKDSCDSD